MSQDDKKSGNILQVLTRKTSKINKGINTVGALSLAVITIGIVTTSKGPDTSKYIQNEVDEVFLCEISPKEDLQEFKLEELKTITQIGTIDIEKDVFHSEYAKGEIPAITNPIHSTFEEISKCTHDSEDVVVVSIEDKVQVYPKRLLSQHLLVNDTIADIPILVSYSNLSDSYRVFKRTYRDETLTFGVSGKIYKNNDLIYDFKTESLWSQLDGIAKIGALTDASLEPMPFNVTTFGYAKEKYPNAKVLSYKTGFIMPYNIVDYGQFDEHDQILQEVTNFDPSLPVKEKILTFTINDTYYAIPKSIIEKDTSKIIKRDGISLTIYNDSNTFYILDDNGDQIQTLTAYWYSWYDFFPETILITN